MTDYFCTQVDEKTQREIVREMAYSYKIDPKSHCKKSVMNWSELKKAASDPLCSVGAHTLNHYHLARLAREEAAFEMAQSAEILAVELGERPKHFAYPYGGKIAAGRREAELAREAGFVSAVTTRHGLIHPNHADALHALPRLSINGEYQRVHYVKTMLSGITVPVANRGRRFTTV
ncbi:MAG: polysaccharide deacetylase family protein [Ahrensia sp.]|nr:polysaccharide deacetylase family protein [Ahrensia sp.]